MAKGPVPIDKLEVCFAVYTDGRYAFGQDYAKRPKYYNSIGELKGDLGFVFKGIQSKHGNVVKRRRLRENDLYIYIVNMQGVKEIIWYPRHAGILRIPTDFSHLK